MKFYQKKNKKNIIAAVYEEWQQEDDPPTREYEAWSMIETLARPPYDCIVSTVYLAKSQLEQEYSLISEEQASLLAPELLKHLRKVARPDEVRPAQATLHAVCTHGPACLLSEHHYSKVKRSRETWYTILNDVRGDPIAIRLTEEGEYKSIYKSPGTLVHGRVLEHAAIIATLQARGYETIHCLSENDFFQKTDEIQARHHGLTVKEWLSF